MMAAADEALENIYSWIEQKELGAKKLLKLADELEALRDKCNRCEVVGNTATVVGCTSTIVAGVAMVFTGGVAAPALALAGTAGAVCSGAGVALTVGTKITEHFLSSSTREEATEIEEDCNRKAQKLQQLFKELKAQSPFPDPDQEDQYVFKELFVAMAKRSGLSDFDPNFLLDAHSFNFGGQQRSMMCKSEVANIIITGLICVLSFFSFAPNGKKMNLLLATGSKKLMQELSSTGLKTAVKGALFVGGAVGLMFSLPDAIESWKKFTTGKHVTKASKSLRETAESFLKATRALKGQLNEIKTTFDRLSKVKLCIENPQRTCTDKMMLVQFVLDLCYDEEVKQWLKENCESVAFFTFVDIFNLVEKQIKKNEERTEEEEEEEGKIDIVFLAHGCITEALIPSICLLSGRITDVLLYSPWNCAINSSAAYGIASGKILPQHRKFYSLSTTYPKPEYYQPTSLPDDWNRMTDATDDLIPNIIVSPVGIPPDGTWETLMYLTNEFGIPDRKRVLIPFMLPGNVDVDVPFYVVTLALSVVLFFTKFKATVHLSACLSKMSEDTKLDVDYLINQYSYTIDKTCMSCSEDVLSMKDRRIYRLLKTVFD